MQTPIGSVTELSVSLPLLAAAPFVGRFLGVLIRRLPESRAVGLARSACEHCGVAVRARELVPMASYLRQRGKCRHCRVAIDPFHLAIELTAIGVPLWAILAESDPDRLWVDRLLGWSLLALGWIDWRWMLLPDVLTLPLLLAGLLLTWWWQPGSVGRDAAGVFDSHVAGASGSHAPGAASSHAAAAAIGYLALRGVAWGYRVLRSLEEMGAGDAKLLGAAGAWLGLTPLPMVVRLAALLGLATAGLLALSGRRLHADTALPFGPWLAAATWLVWLYGAATVNVGVLPWPG